MNTKKLTFLAMFTTLALIIFTIESAIPPLVPIPGIKLGLANIITLVLLMNSSLSDALWVLLTRILLASFFFGQALSLLYSLAGGLCCLLVMYLINRLLQGHFIFLTSIVGAMFHNLGQLSVAYLVVRTTGVISYLPFLMLSGVLTGLFTGLCAYFIQRFLIPATAGSLFFSKSGDDN